MFARFARARGYNVVYVCGTDEYGTATETKVGDSSVTLDFWIKGVGAHMRACAAGESGADTEGCGCPPPAHVAPLLPSSSSQALEEGPTCQKV